MRSRVGGFTALTLGVLLVVGGLVVKFALVPAMAQLPGDVDTTRTYSGTMNTMLNPQALAAGDIGNLFITDTPVSITRHVTVDSTDGSTAIVTETAQAAFPDGTPVANTTDVYALDRKTMEHLTDYSGDNTQVTPREGLVIGWPIGTEQRDYTGWSGDTQAPVTLTYEGTEEHAGLNTYVFKSEISNGVIKDPALLAQFPTAIPKALMAQLAGQLQLPEALQTAFAQLLPQLPDAVPMTYLYSGTTTYWVEPTSGVLVDMNRSETRSAALVTDAAPLPIPLTAVFDWTYQPTDESVAAAVDDAKSADSQLSLFGTWLPYGAIALGVLLLIAAAFLLTGRRGGDDELLKLPEEGGHRAPAGMA